VKREVALAFLLLVVGFGSAFGRRQQAAESSTPVPAEVSKKLTSLLPEGREVGASLTEGPAFYGPGNLYEYIDGGAEAFVGYDFAALGHSVYQKGDAEVTVDVYDMRRPENAFGIYASERSPDYSFVPIGAEGYEGDLLINFVSDRYYVKLSAFSETQKGAALLEPFARKISTAIGAAPSLPKAVSLFPRTHLLPHTQSFVLRSPLGREFLSPAYTAKYSFGGDTETLVVLSFAQNPEAARGRVTQLCAEAEKVGRCAAVDEPRGGFRGSTRYEGKFLAFPRGNVAVIVLNPPGAETDLVAQLLRALDQQGTGEN
jgi:hypothetical protein